MPEDINQVSQPGTFSKKKLIILAAVIIVVILIVIVLVGIMSNARQQEEQAQNNNIKGSLAIVLTNSMIYFDRNSTYNDFCENEYFTGPAAAISAEGQVATCNVKSDNSAWCACTTLKATSLEPGGSTFCIDNRGYKRITQNGCDARCGSAGICSN